MEAARDDNEEATAREIDQAIGAGDDEERGREVTLRRQSSYWNNPCWNQRWAGVSWPWCRAGDIRKQRGDDWTSWYSMCASEDESQKPRYKCERY